jgi:hypothetical protein
MNRILNSKFLFPILVIGITYASPAFAQNHGDVVAQLAAEQPPDHTLEGAAQFLVRVVERLNQLYPNERAGLLEKVDGENIIPYGGTLISASRIAYPDQHLFKLLQDVPTTNRPQWVDDGFASIGGFLKGYLPVAGVPPTPMPPPIVTLPPPVIPPVVSPQPVPIVLDLSSVNAQLAEIAAELHEHVRADGDAHASINQNVTDGRAEARPAIETVKAIGAFAGKYILPAIGGWFAAKHF